MIRKRTKIVGDHKISILFHYCRQNLLSGLCTLQLKLLVNYKLDVLAMLLFMLIHNLNKIFTFLLSPRWLDAHEPQVESKGMDFTEAVINYSL